MCNRYVINNYARAAECHCLGLSRRDFHRRLRGQNSRTNEARVNCSTGSLWGTSMSWKSSTADQHRFTESVSAATRKDWRDPWHLIIRARKSDVSHRRFSSLSLSLSLSLNYNNQTWWRSSGILKALDLRRDPWISSRITGGRRGRVRDVNDSGNRMSRSRSPRGHFPPPPPSAPPPLRPGHPRAPAVA